MSDTTDYLKYVTDRTVAYLNLPAEERRERRHRKRQPWPITWFGQLLPMGLRIWWNNRKKSEQSAAPPGN